MPSSFDATGKVLQAVLDEARQGLSPAPKRVVVSHGEPVWDDCCAGLLYIRVSTLDPVRQGVKCIGWNANMSVGIIRCVETVNDQGTPPSVAKMTADALRMTQDMTDLMHVLACSDYVLTLGTWQSQGPEGGCAGGEWSFVSRIPMCEGC